MSILKNSDDGNKTADTHVNAKMETVHQQ